MKHITSKLLSLLLCLAMLMSMIPAAYATDDGESTGGENSTEDTTVEPAKAVEANLSEGATALTSYVTVNGDATPYATLDEAIAAAEPVNGVITYTINGKVEVTATGWVQVARAGLANLSKVEFVGVTVDAEICITQGVAILADQSYDIDVSFEALKLTKLNPQWTGDYGHSTNYFTCWLRKNDAANNTVTYTNCTFPNGVCNNQYGNTVFDNCKFTNETSGMYNLWNYGGNTEIKNSTFTGVRGIKTYNEGTLEVAPTVTVKSTTFTGLTEKAAIVASKATDITLTDISAINCEKGFFQKDIEGSSGSEKVTIAANGSGIGGNFNITAAKGAEAAGKEFNISAGTFTDAVSSDYLANGFKLVESGGTYGVQETQPAYVAKVGETSYDTLADALAALNSSNCTLTLLNDSAWDTTTPVYWEAGTQFGYAAKLTDALTAAYTANQGDITIVCRPGADVGTMTHGHVADNLTIYGNNAYVSGGECDLEVDTYQFSRGTGAQATDGVTLDKDITITAYELDNLGVWGERNTNHTVTVSLTNCNGKAIEGKKNVQRVYISGTSGINNITVTDCDFLTAATAVYSNADGEIVIDKCSFTGGQVPVNFNHKANGTQTVTVSNSTFTGCGDDGDWKQFAAPARFVNSGTGTSTTAVENCTFSGTVGSNGDILIGDGRTGQASNDVSLKVTNTSANVQAQQPGYYNGDTTDASKKGEKKVEKSDKPFTTSVTELTTSTELTNYVTLELTFGSSVNAEDIAAAKAMYEGKKYETCKAANEAFMALYGVSWVEREGGKPYLNVTDNDAPLRAYATNADAVTEVKYYIHGTLAGFTSLQSDGNQIDCTVGGNHQIPRTSISIIGMNGSDGSKAKLTDGNVQAYVAGGYDNMFRSSGKLTIDNIEFTSTTSTTVGASAAVDANATQTVTSAEMEIKNCVFRGRLYVYDNFENTGMTYNIHNNVFDGRNYSGDSNAYSIFAQCRGGNKLNIKNNDISGFARGINIDHANINAVIEGNTISITDQGRSCIQLSSLATTTISGNTLKLTGGNAITLHEKLLTLTGAPVVSIENNTITGNGYLIYDDAAANNKEFTAENLKLNYGTNTVDNTIDTKQGVKGATKYALSGSVNTVVNGSTAPKGSEKNPYTLEQLGAMTRADYIAAQTRLGGTMYVKVGDYSYEKNGVLGNGVRDDTTGQVPDHSKLNAYGENGYLNEKNDGANGKSIVFVNGSITSGATGYTSIDNIGTSLLLAVPAYTNVTFQNITFKNVMSFDYQLYTSPWSQLGELKFDGCTFNGIIVGAIAAQTLTFTGCTFTDYTNSTSANNSNPTWIRPAYGNWTKGDNEGQGGDFRSLTTINFTGNKVTSTRPVKFERIAQWEMPTTVTATGNSFDIKAQTGDDSTKNVGLYFGANAKFDLVAEGNKKAEGSSTAALYTAVYSAPNGVSYAGLPAGSTVKDSQGNEAKLDALKWKATDTAKDKLTLTTTKEVASLTNAKVTVNFATLQEAIDAAKDGETVTLLADVTEDVTINKNITLDLGSKTLTGKGTANTATLTIAEGVTATVKNGTVNGTANAYYNIQNNGTAKFENVTATAGNDGSSMIDNYGDLTINSGNYTGGLDTIKNEADAKLTITGGTFTLEKGTSKGFTGVVFNYGKLNISGGTFIQSHTSAPYGQAQVIHTDKSGSSAPSTIITGGTFKNLCTKNTAWMVRETNAAAGSTKVSGGTFNKKVSEDYCADGYIPTKNADGTYGVKEGKYVAAVDKTKYETLADAIRLAAKGKTVKLLDDVTENIEIAKAKNFTLDLNGHTINGGTVKDKATITNYGTVTITDKSTAKTGTIKRDDQGVEGETSYYVIRNIGTMTIEQANVVNNSGYRKTNPSGSMVGSSLICNGGDVGATLTINGGTFTQMNFLVVKNDALGTLNVTGGTFTSKHSAIQNWFKANITGGEINGQLWTDSWAVGESVGETTIGGNATVKGEIVMDITGSVKPTLEISGGNFDVTWRITNAAAKAGAKPAVSGGTFSNAVLPEYCAIGFEPTRNTDGTYGVKAAEGNAAMFDAEGKLIGYADVAAALANSDAKTVKLIKDVTDSAVNVILHSGVILDLNGHALTAEFVYAPLGGDAGIIDSAVKGGGTGKLLLKDMKTSMGYTDGYMPIYAGQEDGLHCYKFYTVKYYPVTNVNRGTDAVEIRFWFIFESNQAYKDILDHPDQFRVQLDTDLGNAEEGGARQTLYFEFRQDMITSWAQQNYNGFDSHNGAKFLVVLRGLDEAKATTIKGTPFAESKYTMAKYYGNDITIK